MGFALQTYEPQSLAGRQISLSMVVLGLALLLGGCKQMLSSWSGPRGAVALHGSLQAGQQPISGSAIQLYAAGADGNGSPAIPLLKQTVRSDAAGGFTIPDTYACPSPVSQLYVVARGGNPGLSPGTDNPAIALMAALGTCSELAASSFVALNEVTTVGSVWPVAPYMRSPTGLGSAVNDLSFPAAASRIPQLVDLRHGVSPGAASSTGYVIQTAKLNTLANVLAGCIHSAGGIAGDGSPCGTLFSLATSVDGGTPTDTATAALHIARHPTENLIGLFHLSAKSARFQPTINAAPSDWKLDLLPIAPESVLEVAAAPVVAAPTATAHAAPTATAAMPVIYYVAHSGSDSNSGTSPTTPWKTLAKLNTANMPPGSFAYLRCGSVFRETLTVTQSGTASAPINYGSYGPCYGSTAPIISGADRPHRWTPEAEGVYTAYYAAEKARPAVVFEDNHRLAIVNAKTAMTPGSFFYDSVQHRVYVRTKEDTVPGSHVVEASVRPYAVTLGASYVNLTGIEADKGTQTGILGWGTLSGVTVIGTITNYSYGNGIWFTANTGESQTNVLIKNCTANYNGENGVTKGNFGDNFIVEGCTTNYNAFDPQYSYTAGIRFISDGTTDANRAINSGAINNTAAFNGVNPDTGLQQTSDAGQEGTGVWCDTCGNGSFLTGNITHDNAKNGVMLEFTGASGSLSMTGNIAYRNTSVGILHSRRSRNDLVANNTSYGNFVNCQFSGEYGGGETTVGMINNTYENNICASQVLNSYGTVFVAEWGAENNRSGEGSGNIYRNNSFGVPSATNGMFATYGVGQTMTSYAALDAAYGSSMNSIETDPLLTSPSIGNFALMAGSPCVKTGVGGVDLGAVPYVTTAP